MSQELIANMRQAQDLTRLTVLVGDRQHDRFVLAAEPPEGNRLVTLDGILRAAFPDQPPPAIYDPATGQLTVAGQQPRTVARGEVIRALDTQCPIILMNGEFALEDPDHPRDGDFDWTRQAEHHSRTGDGKTMLFIRVPHLRALPKPLATSPHVRVVALPPANRDERTAYAEIRCGQLAEQIDVERGRLARRLADLSDGWLLVALEKLIRICERQKASTITDIEAIARAITMGVQSSPWRRASVIRAIDQGPAHLANRVRGQPDAVRAVCQALRKAGSGLAGAHQGSVAHGPRATLFFAGPTGVGKTEMARAIAELIFGDETAIIRFDAAEFKDSHSVSRLLGAPPGYVGFESGGELTERVRARPHSVILFDEIEKAHPRLLDLFLSILDDGRLTDGQGVTTYFGECILIFTSNMGIFTEDKDGIRRARFTLNTPFVDIQQAVRAAIRDAFISQLGRPELLGRLGSERAIVVFDFLRDVPGVIRKFLDRIGDTVTKVHGVHLNVSSDVVDAIAAKASGSDALTLGARGVAQVIEEDVTGPLSDHLFLRRQNGGEIRVSLAAGQIVIA